MRPACGSSTPPRRRSRCLRRICAEAIAHCWSVSAPTTSRRRDPERGRASTGGAIMAKQWTAFPHADAAFEYKGAALRKAWARLHKGDREPYPADAAVADAWRHFHAGAFRHAVQNGLAAGGPGVNAAVKAQCVYAHYLERNEKARLTLLEEAIGWADDRRASAESDA